jgi:autotransporter strand-loop-strand O-heptosyltransferase
LPRPFATHYRVINWHAGNGCWNDPHHGFDHKDFLWCPQHAGTPRQFGCTRLITAEQVKQTIRRILGFGVHDPKMSVVANVAE